MNAFFEYLLESSICLILFYGVYHFVLRKDTFYNSLRIYILVSIIVSLVIPVIPNHVLPNIPATFQTRTTITSIKNFVPSSEKLIRNVEISKPSPYIMQVYNTKKFQSHGSGFNTTGIALKILLIIYIAGVIYFLIRFLLNIYKIVSLIIKNENVIFQNLKIIYLKSETHSFSFFNFVFLQKDHFNFSDEQQIISHEKIHVRQLHTLDILFIEFIKLILWFNPSIWLFKSSIVRLHEFQADEQLLKNTSSPENYIELLLKQHLGIFNIELVNPFNSSLLKTRILMINKARSAKTARMKLLFALPVLAFVLYSFTKSGTENTSNVLNQKYTDKISELINYYLTSNQFNGNIIVYQNDKNIYQKSHGYADFKSKRELNINTPFLLGQVTEPFTALSIVILKEHGKLKYSDSLSQYFTDLPGFMGPVTIQQLLTHTSGIPPSDDYWPVATGVTTNSDIYNIIRKMDRLYFIPGTEYLNSTSGYILLALIIEKVSGQSYQQFVKSNILSPAKMKDTYFLDEKNYLSNNRAVGYDSKGEIFDHQQFTFGNTGIVSTVFDLHKFENSVYSGKIVSMSELKDAITPATLTSGKKIHYGYGFAMFGENNEKKVGGYSWYGGTKTLLWSDLDSKNSIITATNNSWPRFEEMAGKISRILSDKPYTVPIDRVPVEINSDSVRLLIGDYKIEGNKGDIKIKIENDKPFLTYANSEYSFQLYAETPEKFFIKEYDLEYIFQKNEMNEVTGFTIHGDEDINCIKVK